MSQRGIGKRKRSTAAYTARPRNEVTNRFVLLPTGYCPESACAQVDRLVPRLSGTDFSLIRTLYDTNSITEFVQDLCARIEAAEQAFISIVELVIVVPLGYAQEFADRAMQALHDLFESLHVEVVQEGQS